MGGYKMGMFKDLAAMIFGVDNQAKLERPLAPPIATKKKDPFPDLMNIKIEEMEKALQPLDIHKLPDSFSEVIALIESHGHDSNFFVNKSFPAKDVVPNADFSEWIIRQIRNNDFCIVDRLIYEIRRDAFGLTNEVSKRAAMEREEGKTITIHSMQYLSNICNSQDEGYSVDFMAAIAIMTLNGALCPNKYSWGRGYNYLGAVMFPYSAVIDAGAFLETIRKNYRILTEDCGEGSIRKSELSLRFPKELIAISDTLKTLPFSARCKFFREMGCYGYSIDRLGGSDIYVDHLLVKSGLLSKNEDEILTLKSCTKSKLLTYTVDCQNPPIRSSWSKERIVSEILKSYPNIAKQIFEETYVFVIPDKVVKVKEKISKHIENVQNFYRNFILATDELAEEDDYDEDDDYDNL